MYVYIYIYIYIHTHIHSMCYVHVEHQADDGFRDLRSLTLGLVQDPGRI